MAPRSALEQSRRELIDEVLDERATLRRENAELLTMLTKYIDHIVSKEGITYLRPCDRSGYRDSPVFTDAEWNRLREIAKEPDETVGV